MAHDLLTPHHPAPSDARLRAALGSGGVWPDGPGGDGDPSPFRRMARIPLAVFAALLAAVYGPAAVQTLIDCWNDSNYSHGVLLPVVVALLMRARHHDVHLQARGTAQSDVRRAWVCFLAGCGGFVLGTAASESFAMRTSGVLVATGLCGVLGGSRGWRRYAPAVALLVCAIPLPYVIYYRISVPLQLLSARLAVGTLTALGLDVTRSGNVFEVGGHALEVVGACSGIRSIMALTTLTCVGAVWLRVRPLRGAALVLVAPFLAMLGNVLRLVVTALLVLRFGVGAAEGVVHESVGVVSFAASLALLAGLMKWARRGELALPPTSRAGRHSGNWRGWLGTVRATSVRSAWVAVAVFAVVGIYGFVLRSHAVEPTGKPHLETVPLQLAGYEGQDIPIDDRVLNQVQPDAFLFRNYVNDAASNVGLYMGYYVNPREGAQIHSPMHCYPGGGWDILASAPLAALDPAGQPTQFQRLVVRKDGRTDVVVFWYETRTGRLTSDIGLKFNLMRTALLHAPQDVAFVRWSTPLDPEEDVEAGTARLLQVAASAWSDVETALPFAP